MADYQAFVKDDCEKYTCPDFSCGSQNETETYRDMCITDGSSKCFWVPDGLNDMECDACTPICRNPEKTLNIIQYTVGYSLIILASTLGRNTISTLFSNLLGPSKQVSEIILIDGINFKFLELPFIYFQGSMSGIFIAAAAIGKLLFAVLSVYAYDETGRKTYVLMLTLAGLNLFSFLKYLMDYKKLDHKLYYRAPTF